MIPPSAATRLRVLVVVALAASWTAAGHAQLRAATYNVARLNGESAALGAVLEELIADDVPGFATAPAVLVFQEVRTQDLSALSALVSAAGSTAGVDYVAATFTSSPSENGSGGAQALFYRSDLLEEIDADHADLATGAGRDTDRWHLRLLEYDEPQVSLWIYSSHLKAGGTPQDEATRLAGVDVIRADAATLGADANIIFAGDMNFSSSSDDAYQAFVAPGESSAHDPLGNGSWSGPGNAWKHTQSPRDVIDGPLIGGGMDDRFDVQLLSAALSDGAGLSLMTETYRALGNDGEHYNTAINAGVNTYFPGDAGRSGALADALFDASDHIPVVASYQLPAVASAALTEEFGRVIQGASVEVEVLVANIAEVQVPEGADVLSFTVTGAGAFSGVTDGVVGPLPDLAVVPVAVDTSEVGFVKGVAQVVATSEEAQNPLWTLFSSGEVVRPANASFDGDTDLDISSIAWNVRADSGVQTVELQVHNLGFDGDQARLDVLDVEGLDGAFGVSGALPEGIGALPGTLHLTYDTVGATPGSDSATTVITVRDEEIPGAAESTLLLFVNVTVTEGTLPGDLDGDGQVSGADLGLLLSAWGECDGCAADLDGDGQVSGSDLGVLLGGWTGD